ncbi:MAG TPA: M23 family metallopeptidase [Elusimicrobiota bacterium]|nr:M23 family metallopeptidase [Elusimicrobiota bacterium]
MELHKRVADFLSRPLTVLVIPQTRLKPWRWQVSTGFFLFMVGLWSGVTIWAGFISGRHVDYWITKADNEVMLVKMTRLAQEMERAQRVLDQADSTDRQLRGLLSMARDHDPIEAATGMGGPTLADRLSLDRLLSSRAGSLRQADWHHEISRIRVDAEKRLASFQEVAWYVGNQKSLRNATPSIWPTEGQITSLFGYRLSPIRRDDGEPGTEFHPGVDIANVPDTLISATADGTVVFSGWSHGYGNLVVIDHGYGIQTLYGHTSKALVKAGDRVSKGQVIAYMGTTGRSTGAHLHYEIRRQGVAVNPMQYLKVRGPGELLGFAHGAGRVGS